MTALSSLTSSFRGTGSNPRSLRDLRNSMSEIIIGVDPGLTTGIAVICQEELLLLTEGKTDIPAPKELGIIWHNRYEKYERSNIEDFLCWNSVVIYLEVPWEGWARTGEKAMNVAPLAKCSFYAGMLHHWFLAHRIRAINLVEPRKWREAIGGRRASDEALWRIFEWEMRDKGLWNDMYDIFINREGSYIQAREHIRDAYLIARYGEGLLNMERRIP